MPNWAFNADVNAAQCRRLTLALVPSYSASCRPPLTPALRLSPRFLLGGFGALRGFACVRFGRFKPFWPPALASQAPPAIILAVLRRFRGSALLRGLCPSSSQGAPFWPSGLTLRSSGLAFSQPLTLAVSLRKTRFIQPHVLFTGIYLFKRLFVGFWVSCRASPFGAAPVSNIFCKHCAASVAQRFFTVCARRQTGVSRSGFWV